MFPNKDELQISKTFNQQVYSVYSDQLWSVNLMIRKVSTFPTGISKKKILKESPPKGSQGKKKED